MERYLAICHPLHMFAMGDFQRGLRVIRYVLGLVCTMPKLVILDFLKLFWSFLSIWHPLRMFDMGDFQRGLRVIRNVPCQNCQPRLFKTACQTVIFSSGVTKDFENNDSNFSAAFYWLFVKDGFRKRLVNPMNAHPSWVFFCENGK